jgi:hypothetical protein
MSLPMKDLRNLTDEELIALYDAQATRTSVGLDYYREELHRREQVAASRSNYRLARASWWLSLGTLALSIIAIVVALRQ